MLSGNKELIVNNLEKLFDNHIETVQALYPLIPNIETFAKRVNRCLAAGGKVLWMGNGGSAADSQHLAAEFVGRFLLERKGLASIALTTDTSVLTAVGNDYGFEMVFARQIEALCQEGDVVVGISTSGNSPNICAGLRAATTLGAFTVALTGHTGGKAKALADLCIAVPSPDGPRVQEAHILIGHSVCEWVEKAFVTRDEHV